MSGSGRGHEKRGIEGEGQSSISSCLRVQKTSQIKSPTRMPFRSRPCGSSSHPRVSSLLLHTASSEAPKPPSSRECTSTPKIAPRSRSCRGCLSRSYPRSILRVFAAALHSTAWRISRRFSREPPHQAVRSAAGGRIGSEAPRW